mmetsp:Transcript_23985/g.66681  ORF Transcript_23985/g.66681 Transcript_23985/m.66681 type:complete len:249 (+) Transcript_23985:84-830(+)|eukprot:CAMPEP_0117594232 /NCGR_PEP_ID=MMETSP0784-20121206/73084_1 /TAXON_ID=39447 /ORGANISM="" /LENGTH=248 /DNA_ID=CAMNT_0005396263 /DNA_START=79 /DNA_END=825 /DNA_ORIENTATION=-
MAKAVAHGRGILFLFAAVASFSLRLLAPAGQLGFAALWLRTGSSCSLLRRGTSCHRPSMAAASTSVDDAALGGERLIDPNALAAVLEAAGDEGVHEDDGSSGPEPWEAMVDRIQFEGGVPDAGNFRAPGPMPSAYEVENGFREVDVLELRALLSSTSSDLQLWDVRDAEEYALGHLPGAKNVPFDALDKAGAAQADVDVYARLFLVCGFGMRSAQAQVRLAKVYGLRNVETVRGGIAAWEAAGARLEV